jgi:hypothetical protein
MFTARSLASVDSVWEPVVGALLGPEREEVTGRWIKLHIDELHHL